MKTFFLTGLAVLEDTDSDGRMDKRTEFLSGLNTPRAIALVKGGVLISEPPVLWYCQDTDGDLKADKKTEAFRGYATQGPVEHTENGLMPGLDNWLYNAKSTKRLKFVDGKVVVENTVFRGQWGIAQDNYGRLYYNSNSAPLFCDTIPGVYTVRNPHHPTRNGLGYRLWEDGSVWTSRLNTGINRGYQNGMLRDGRLARWTGASGPMIYRGDQYPAELVGDAFIPEPAGNMIRLQKLTWKDGRPSGANAYEKAEWLTSTDERFRPVSLYNGPDGCVYIVDMYRGILQHKHYVTTFLRKQIIDRKLDKHIGLGRIYRVVHTGRKPQAAPKMSEQGYEQLIGHLESGNGWRRDTAQRLLVERNEKAALPILRETATASEYHLARQHALWALEGLDGLDAPTIAQALGDKHPRVRIAALRVAESFTAKQGSREADTEARLALLPALTEVAQDENADVRQQMALSLPAIKVLGSEPLLRTFVVKHAENSVVRDGLISGLAGRELEFLQRVAANENWVTNGNLRNIVQALAGCVARQRNAARLEQLLKLAQSLPSAAQINFARWHQQGGVSEGAGLETGGLPVTAPVHGVHGGE